MRRLLIRKGKADELELAECGSHEGEAEGKTRGGADDGVGGGGVDVGGLEAEGDYMHGTKDRERDQ